MIIFIITSGNELPLEIESSATLYELHIKIKERLGTKGNLILAGKSLKESKKITLEERGIKEESKLHFKEFQNFKIIAKFEEKEEIIIFPSISDVTIRDIKLEIRNKWAEEVSLDQELPRVFYGDEELNENEFVTDVLTNGAKIRVESLKCNSKSNNNNNNNNNKDNEVEIIPIREDKINNDQTDNFDTLIKQNIEKKNNFVDNNNNNNNNNNDTCVDQIDKCEETKEERKVEDKVEKKKNEKEKEKEEETKKEKQKKKSNTDLNNDLAKSRKTKLFKSKKPIPTDPISLKGKTFKTKQLFPSTAVKLVTIGEVGVGKTSMLITFTSNEFPLEYIPTVFDNYSPIVMYKECCVLLGLWDIGGQESYDRIRVLNYIYSDVFLICFSVSDISSFQKRYQWIAEINYHAPGVPFIYVATKADLLEDKGIDKGTTGRSPTERLNNNDNNNNMVKEDDIRKAAEEDGASAYVICSSLTQMNLKNVFDTALNVVFDPSNNTKN